ncbi:hypothetical protein B0H17DRAFT_856761, partial [Mycena rosella]
IIHSCCATLFATTWVAVHPNVPASNEGSFKLVLRRLRIMLVALIAPEVIVFFAARHVPTARIFSKGKTPFCIFAAAADFHLKFGISTTDGFFLSMGAFVSQDGHHPITTMKQLEDSPAYLSAIKAVNAENIMDKSKGDSFSKGIAVLQTLWFIIQCIARRSQWLPITQLEMAALAFAVVNVQTWLLWWNKPLDVHRP